MSVQAPAPRLIDPRGQRFGAGLSAVILALAIVAGQSLVVPLVAVALGVSAYFGTRWFLFGRPWPVLRRALRLKPPRELEHETPPRFAQAFGSVVLTAATILFVAGLPLLAWLFTAAVGALQLLLAATGYCLGCRLYGLRWYAPRLFDRLIASAAPEAVTQPGP